MASIIATNRTVTITPMLVSDSAEYGPTDEMGANAILITSEKMKTVGFDCPRIGYPWSCNVQINDSIAGVTTGHNLSGYTSYITAYGWDPVSKTVMTDLGFSEDGDQTTNPGLGVLTFDHASAKTAGMFRFIIIGSDDGSTNTMLASGWFQIKAQQD